MNRPWSKDETIIAFNLYCKIPFKDSSKTHPLVIKYANLLGRSPSALNMKIGNIGRLDPDLKKKGITGLTHGAKIEKEVWDEFHKNPELLAFESEKLIARFANQSVEESLNINTKALPQGKEREIIVKQRINQSFFRMAVLSSYNNRCCVSGIGNIELLEACHITGWSENTANRTNPQNGLCMNPFFHKAYDSHLMGITPDYTIIISSDIIDNINDISFKSYLSHINNKKITLPDKFLPKKEFLEIHYTQFKQKWAL